MSNIVTGIDVGTYHVKAVIAQRHEDERQPPRILGTGYAESRGMRHGYITSLGETGRSITAAVAQAQKAARVRVKGAYVGLGGAGLDEYTARGETVVERGDSQISERDLSRAAAAAAAALPPSATLNRRILHQIPLRYFVDGVRVLGRNPAGMSGGRVGVEVLFITCLERHVHDLMQAVEEAGFSVEDVVAAPVAASFVALSKTQKRVGCVLANMGAETLSIIVFEDTVPISVKVFPIGGTDVTHDLALSLRISPEDAQELKHGAILGAPYPKRKIEDVIAKRVTEMFKLVETHLKKIGKNELLPAGIILTGGSSALQSAADLAKSALRLPSRLAEPPSSQRMQLQDSTWAVAYGLTIWGLTQGGDLEGQNSSEWLDPLHSLWRWFKKFLP